MRSLISRAARLVKVTQRTLSGGTPEETALATRCAKAKVFPVPTEACSRMCLSKQLINAACAGVGLLCTATPPHPCFASSAPTGKNLPEKEGGPFSEPV